jgi:hypothetical protein
VTRFKTLSVPVVRKRIGGRQRALFTFQAVCFSVIRLVEPLVGWVGILVGRVEHCLLTLFQIRRGLLSCGRLMSSGTLQIGAPAKCQEADDRQDHDCL